jgi:hypothetical protein
LVRRSCAWPSPSRKINPTSPNSATTCIPPPLARPPAAQAPAAGLSLPPDLPNLPCLFYPNLQPAMCLAPLTPACSCVVSQVLRRRGNSLRPGAPRSRSNVPLDAPVPPLACFTGLQQHGGSRDSKLPTDPDPMFIQINGRKLWGKVLVIISQYFSIQIQCSSSFKSFRGLVLVGFDFLRFRRYHVLCSYPHMFFILSSLIKYNL